MTSATRSRNVTDQCRREQGKELLAAARRGSPGGTSAARGKLVFAHLHRIGLRSRKDSPARKFRAPRAPSAPPAACPGMPHPCGAITNPRAWSCSREASFNRRMLAYGLSLGASRGGPVFPSTFIGAAIGIAESVSGNAESFTSRSAHHLLDLRKRGLACIYRRALRDTRSWLDG